MNPLGFVSKTNNKQDEEELLNFISYLLKHHFGQCLLYKVQLTQHTLSPSPSFGVSVVEVSKTEKWQS